MKKICTFLLFAAVIAAASACAAAPALSASAETENDEKYARIVADGVYFYSSADETAGLFILPRTYFVKIVGEAGDYYRVRYLEGYGQGAALEGYCRADEIEPVDYIPSVPYLDYSITVTYRTEGGGISPSDSFLTEYTVAARYYGEFVYDSATCYYVRIGDEAGYVPAAACSVPDYPENTEHTQTETPAPAPSEEGKSFGTLNIVLICVLAVVALGAVYFLFRPAKLGKNASSPYDETEDVF